MEFPAKILLFGEYGILLNSPALAIPFPKFSGRFEFCNLKTAPASGMEADSNNELKNIFNYLKLLPEKFDFLNLSLLQQDIDNGLYFNSTIPSGSGLGSSGALTAALYERYATDLPLDEKQILKAHLAAIESCFHGTSSGVDPLTSFLNEPLLLNFGPSPITLPDISTFCSHYSLALINTDSKGNTGELVGHFKEKYNIQDFKDSVDNEYLPLISQTIEAVLQGDIDKIDPLLSRYSKFQLSKFARMIPASMITHFEHGISSGDFHLKLCGSGGGGYLLAFSHNILKAENYFKMNHLDFTIV